MSLFQTKLWNKLIYLTYKFVLFVIGASSILINVPFHETEYIGQTYKHAPSAVVFALFIKAFSLQTLFDKHFRCLCKPGALAQRTFLAIAGAAMRPDSFGLSKLCELSRLLTDPPRPAPVSRHRGTLARAEPQ